MSITLTKYLKTIILCFLFALPLLSKAQHKATPLETLVTDRPDATESPNTVHKGYIQFETGGLYESFETNGFKTESYVYNTTLVRYGLLDNLELRLGWDLLETQVTSNQTRVSSNGLNPLLLGVKVAISEEHAWLPKVGLIGHLFLPFIASNDFKPETTGIDFRFAFSHTLSDTSNLSYNIGAQVGDDSSELSYVYTIAYGYSVTNKFGAYVELYGDLPENSNPNHLWDAGVTYLIPDNFQLDATVGTSITEGQDILLSAGISFRLPINK